MTTPDTSPYPALTAALNQAFVQSGEAVKLLVDTFNKGVHNLNANPLICLVPDFVSGLDDALDRLRDYIDKFCKAAVEFLKHRAPIIALIETSFDWVTEMKTPVTGLSGKITELAAKFLSALVAAGTIVGALEAIGKAADFAGDLLKNAVGVFADSVKFYTAAIGYMREAEDLKTERGAFPEKRWPKVGTR